VASRPSKVKALPDTPSFDDNETPNDGTLAGLRSNSAARSARRTLIVSAAVG